jgi:hypothetical protein
MNRYGCLTHDYEPLDPDCEITEGMVFECHCGAQAVKRGDLMIEVHEYRRQNREPAFDMVGYANGLLKNWRVR